MENIERLGLANYQTGYFDKIYSGCVGLATIRHDVEILGRLTRLLKPGGHLSYVESLETGADPATLSSALILAGLSATSQPTVLQSFPSLEATLAKLKLTEASLYVVTAKKPNHEVGASRLLSFAKPAAVPAPASVWTLDDLEDDSVELLDEKTLLSEEDLVKPDPTSLKVRQSRNRDILKSSQHFCCSGLWNYREEKGLQGLFLWPQRGVGCRK